MALESAIMKKISGKSSEKRCKTKRTVTNNCVCLHDFEALNLAKMDVKKAVDDLVASVASGQTERVKELLESGIDVHSHDSNGMSALGNAAMMGNLEMVDLLIKFGAADGVQDPESSLELDALILACSNGHLESVKKLVEAGFKDRSPKKVALNIQVNEPALVAASRKGHLSIVEFLLEQGFDPNKCNMDCIGGQYGQEGGNDDTPLVIAARNGHLSVCQILLANGADVNGKGKCGDTAVDAAKRHKHEQVVQLLQKKGGESSKSESSSSKLKIENFQMLHQKLASGPDDRVKESRDQGKLTVED